MLESWCFNRIWVTLRRSKTNLKREKQVQLKQSIQPLMGRRNFIKKLTMTTAGVSVAALVANTAAHVKQGGDIAKDDLERLSRAYTDLDKRTKIIVRGMFVLLGIDVLLII